MVALERFSSTGEDCHFVIEFYGMLGVSALALLGQLHPGGVGWG